MKQEAAPSLDELDEHLQIQAPAITKRHLSDSGCRRRGNRFCVIVLRALRAYGVPVLAGVDRRSAEEAAVMTEEFTPLTIQNYAAQALATDQGSDSGSLTFPLLGLFGETGSLLSEVKKKQRDRASYLGYAGAVVEELGDVLWYLTAVAARGGLSLSDIAANLGRGYSDWQRSRRRRAFLRLPAARDHAAAAEPSCRLREDPASACGRGRSPRHRP